MSLLETVNIACPYCGEPNTIVIDTSMAAQEYIEECTVCCRPMLLRIVVGEDGGLDVNVRRENE